MGDVVAIHPLDPEDAAAYSDENRRAHTKRRALEDRSTNTIYDALMEGVPAA